jgi:uncharacterized metal-binding protein YceD (DUF177 family)
MPPETTSPEFSRPVPLGTIGLAGRNLAITATAEECAALSRRFQLLGIADLVAEVRLTSEEGGTVLAEGRLTATVTQACVVSLEPVEQRVAESLKFRLLPPGREEADGPDDLDEIACPDDVADLGEAVAEQLALALDPYPRAPDAELPPEAQEDLSGAFAELAALRRRQ